MGRPKAAFQFKSDDRGLSGHQCVLCLPTIGQEANACEAEKHHGPCGGFGDGANVPARDIDDQGIKESRISPVDEDRELVRAETCQCGG
jgi:hypothetical protein